MRTRASLDQEKRRLSDFKKKVEESPKAKHSEVTFDVKGSNAGVIFVRRWELGYKREGSK